MRLVSFGANRPERFYRGGDMIAAFRGVTEVGGGSRPEDWLASTTALFGQTKLGLSRVNGRPLRDWISAEPNDWLGPSHVAIFGSDPALLVKLLAPGERLPIHAHPNRQFARANLGIRWGKTEAWYVLGAKDGTGEAYLGWRQAVDRDILAARVASQDSASLLGDLHNLRLEPGDVLLVPAGTPHAIGPGLLLIELQEPSDLSVLLEWAGYGVDGLRDGHLGLGFENALAAVTTDAMPTSRLAALHLRASQRGSTPAGGLLPLEASAFFRANRIDGLQSGSLQPRGYAVLVVISGTGLVTTEHDEVVPVHRGMTMAVPFGAGTWRLEGEVEAICCRPPLSYAAPEDVGA